MAPLIVRRTSSHATKLATPILAGLAIGAVAGFLLGEWFGPRAERRRTTPIPKQPRRSMAELVEGAQAALIDDPQLGPLALEVIPISPHRVELHGWVPDRQSRTRAARVVARAVGDEAMVNRLLVRGEDDSGRPDLGVVSA